MVDAPPMKQKKVQQVHNLCGKKCYICDKEFTRNSGWGSIVKREGGFIIQRRVCLECKAKEHRDQYEHISERN